MPVGFQITEELQNQTGGKIGHGQPLDRLVEVLADIGQQQAERVPIAGAGVLGQIPFSYDIFDEEAPQPRAKDFAIGHAPAPFLANCSKRNDAC